MNKFLGTPEDWERRAESAELEKSEQWPPGYEAFGNVLALGAVIKEHGDRLKRDRTEQGEYDD